MKVQHLYNFLCSWNGKILRDWRIEDGRENKDAAKLPRTCQKTYQKEKEVTMLERWFNVRLQENNFIVRFPIWKFGLMTKMKRSFTLS